MGEVVMDTVKFNALVDRAKDLVVNRRVLNASKYATSRVWFCEILDEKHLYEVLLDSVNDQLDTCTCSQFDKDRICSHVLAAELYLSTKGIHRKARVLQVAEQTAHPVISTFKNVYQVFLSHKPSTLSVELHVIFHEKKSYIDQTSVELQLKIGKDKLYVVTHLRSFMQSYHNQGIYELGKHMRIDWKQDIIPLNVQHVLLLIQESLRYPVNAHFMANQQKSIALHPLLSTRLFDLIASDSSIRLSYKTKTGLVPLTYGKTLKEALHAKVIYDDKNLKVSLDKPISKLDDEMSYAIIGQNLVYLTADQQNFLLTSQIADNNALFLDNPSDIQDFLIYAFPKFHDMLTLDVTSTQTFMKMAFHVYEQDDFLYVDVLDSAMKVIEPKQLLAFLSVVRQYHLVGSHDLQFSKVINERYEILDIIAALKLVGVVHYDHTLEVVTLTQPLEMYLTHHNGFFEINFDFEMDKIDTKKILDSLKNNDKFYQLENGQLLSLDDDYFSGIHDVLQSIRGKLNVNNNALQVSRLEAITMASNLKHVHIEKDIQQLVSDLANPHDFSVMLPTGLKTDLKNYQIEGFKWLKMLSYHELGGILADDMGLGKTVQTIAYILSEVETQHVGGKPCLIIAPTSLLYNWEKEFQQFAPTLNVTIISGDKNERLTLLDKSHSDVLITSYHTFRQDSDVFSQKEWHCVVLDESQMVKNSNTKTHKSLRQLNTLRLFALSGTPIENRKEELWSIFSLILPGLFPSLRDYRNMAIKDIVKTAKPFLLRRVKEQVLDELPELIEKVLYNELSDDQKSLYVTYLQQVQRQVSGYSDAQLSQHHLQVLTALTRLRQICNHPQLFLDDYTGQSGKLEQFLEQVTRAIANGHRILVFSQFTSMLGILEETLRQNDISSFILTGHTPSHKRQELVDRFNNGEKNVFLISLKAGGTGLNLTSADTIILYDLWWNPAVEEQAKSRAHRIGQKNTVQVYRMVSAGTIEEKIMLLQEKKKALFDEMIDAQATGHNQYTLSNEDIKEILGIL